jgi:hypothetical protein
LSLDWRISRREENSGVYIRIPAPTVANALQAADAQGHEIQIDQRGFDSVTNTEGHPLKVTGAIYDLQAPFGLDSGRDRRVEPLCDRGQRPAHPGDPEWSAGQRLSEPT